ncbi:MAG: cupin domain-containing protein [Acidobacteriaceae bacterium]|nr:cupin domain-containing protein [Acidobacteriaceae bacterium]
MRVRRRNIPEPADHPPQALPETYDGARPFGSVLYFLVTREARIRLHRIRSDQMYHYYLGDPLEVLLLYSDGSGAVTTVGPDLKAGMRPQLFVPGGTFHVSRLRPGGSYALLGTTEWPGVEPADVELGSRDDLEKVYPAFLEEISAFTYTGN